MKKSKTPKTWKPQDWQKDPSRITTDRVQYWRGMTMMSCTMTNAEAREAVRLGSAFVITSQAIGALNENGEIY